MNRIPDDAITEAIHSLGMLAVQRLQQELVEGMRNGEPHGYVDLRKLLRRLEQTSSLKGDTNGRLRQDLEVIEAAFDISGGDLDQELHWFQTEQLPPLGQKTAEQAVAAGHADHVIALEIRRRSGS